MEKKNIQERKVWSTVGFELHYKWHIVLNGCLMWSCLGYVFLMVGFEWRLLVKDNMDRGKSVYNRNVTLDVDPKCILVVQIYYRVFLGAFFKSFGYKQKYILFFFLFWCLGWGGAVILPEIAWSFHRNICLSNSILFGHSLSTFPSLSLVVDISCSSLKFKEVCAGCLPKSEMTENGLFIWLDVCFKRLSILWSAMSLTFYLWFS